MLEDPLTVAGSQSSDNQAVYVQMYLASNQGKNLANESVQQIVNGTPALSDIKAYMIGGAVPAGADQSTAGEHRVQQVTMITFLVDIVMLLFVYCSVVQVNLTLVMVVIELMVARQGIIFQLIITPLDYHNLSGKSACTAGH
ncbi:hypothetical protein DIJ64_13075 [Mycobacterium leprae]|uniref:Membrane transport protein MMPL domain-containing protein n=1 Tax=Mycobacterium leprae TaxID=1769 RepID=A0AAD0KTT2_MYCLR|nr:hypothetical protein DIJ64_13075 [Mycobacterium leprae]